MNKIQLNFAGPFTLVDGETSVFKSTYVKSEGIYLWTIKQNKGNYHLVHYIGETNNLAKRQKEHLNAILGLYYGIFNPEKAINGISELIWKGTWRIKDNTGPAQQIKVYEEITPVVLKYLSIISIFFAETSIDDNKRKHIEGIIAKNLRNNYPEFKSLYPDDNRTGVKVNKYNEKIIIKYSEEIKGINQEMEI